MNSELDKFKYWTACPKCKGLGTKSRGLSKKARLGYQQVLDVYEASGKKGEGPVRPKGHQYTCTDCSGTGILSSQYFPEPNENYPHVAIIGGGIGGTALAVACLHRGIPFTLYERDENFEARSQGYGLTLQQASKAMEGFGIASLQDGVVSTRHVVHNTEGKKLGEWGNRKWVEATGKSAPKRTNVHIARQSLRLELLNQLRSRNTVKWGHQLIDFKETTSDGVTLNFQVNGKNISAQADVVVGADGIKSSVRRQVIGEDKTPLRYLGCIVILGICSLSDLSDLQSDLLDSSTVFQTANGVERIYIMPFDKDSVMWQLSFPMSETNAKKLSTKGVSVLKEEACSRTMWHNPIPQIMKATQEGQISGYPVYDRELLSSELLAQNKQITLLGDAAHPMSPFKGQGANQALLDALSLARTITKGCNTQSDWKTTGIRESVLNDYESEMLTRSATKVKDSAAAADFLHSDIVLHEGDEPRGRVLKRK